MAIGKLLLKLGIDTTNLDKELGKVEKSMTSLDKICPILALRLTQSLTLPIIGVGAAALKILCRHGKVGKWINSHYGK
jgi:hypothetical protein